MTGKHRHGTEADVHTFVLRRTLADHQTVKQWCGKAKAYTGEQRAQPQKDRRRTGQQVQVKAVP